MPGVARLRRGGIAVRTVATLVVAAALLTGTFFGTDDAFPFGPFRMYATSNAPTGAISVVAIEVRVEDGPWVSAPLTPGSVGMNRAEVEGQLPRFVAEPALLGRLAEAHSRLRPDDPPWTALRLVRRSTVIEERVPTGEVRETVIGQWSA